MPGCALPLDLSDKVETGSSERRGHRREDFWLMLKVGSHWAGLMDTLLQSSPHTEGALFSRGKLSPGQAGTMLPPRLKPVASPLTEAACLSRLGLTSEITRPGRTARLSQAVPRETYGEKACRIVLFENIEVLDFCGPFEVFAVTRLNEAKRREEPSPFEVWLVARKTPLSLPAGV